MSRHRTFFPRPVMRESKQGISVGQIYQFNLGNGALLSAAEKAFGSSARRQSTLKSGRETECAPRHTARLVAVALDKQDAHEAKDHDAL
jgi:hypothetical protein